VRHASALVVGELKLRRGVAPLISQVRSEPSEAWTEIARGLGAFGPIAFKRVVGAFKNTGGSNERFVLVLSHLSNHGCARQLEDLRKDPDEWIATAARTAVARRSGVQWEDSAVRTGRKLGDAGQAARYSQMFFSETAKVKIE
jgi:hypothetical protein